MNSNDESAMSNGEKDIYSGLDELRQLTELLYISYLLSLKAAENIKVGKKDSLVFQLQNMKKFLIQIQDLQKNIELKCRIG